MKSFIAIQVLSGKKHLSGKKDHCYEETYDHYYIDNQIDLSLEISSVQAPT